MNQDPVTIVPSYPAPNFEELLELGEDVASVARELQVDVVDGQFAPSLSWPFTETDNPGALEWERLRELPESLELAMDCMVIQPEQYLDVFVENGVSRVVIHLGSTNEYEACLAHRAEHGYLMGLAVVPSVRIGDARPFIDAFDYIQVMGIETVGAQGQPFDQRAIDVITALKTEWPQKEISVDGAVSRSTIAALVAAGASRLAPGSAIVLADDRIAAYEELYQIANAPR